MATMRLVALSALVCAVTGQNGEGNKSHWPADAPTPELTEPEVDGLVKNWQPLQGAPYTGQSPATAAQAMAAWGYGINLGDVYDLPDMFPERLPAERNKKYIDSFIAKGFSSVRIPITWGDSFDGSKQMTKWLTEVVNYALSKGLWVLINTHHEKWLKCCYDGTAGFNNKFTKLWEDIANHFASANDHLLFEVLNEPEDAFGDWVNKNPDPMDGRGHELTRQICNVGVKAIRSVSPTRIVLCAPNAQGNVFQATKVFPGKYSFDQYDDYMGVTLHTYDPWGFCGQDGSNSFWNEQDMHSKYDEMFGIIEGWQRDTGLPVNFGEYGVGRMTTSDKDADIVREYYHYLTQGFKTRLWAPTIWDDEGWYAVELDWKWIYGLVDAAMRSDSNGPGPSPGPPPSGGVCCWGGCGTENCPDNWCSQSAANCAACGFGSEWCPGGPSPPQPPSPPSPPSPPTPPSPPPPGPMVNRCCWGDCTKCPGDKYCDGNQWNCQNCGDGAQWCSVPLNLLSGNATLKTPRPHRPQRHLRAQIDIDTDASAMLQEYTMSSMIAHQSNEEL